MAAKPIEIAILGAGIAGLTLAIALASSSSSSSSSPPLFHVTIYEQRPAFSEIGAGIGFGPNSVRAMKLISPDIAAVYAKVMTSSKLASKDKIWLDVRWGHDIDGTAHKGGELVAEIETEKGNVHGGASRKAYLDGLVRLVPEDVTTQFEKKAVDVVEGDHGSVRILFEDGSEAKADAVIGCDGIRSNARKSLLGSVEAAKARYTGKYAYRKVVSMKKAVEAVGIEVENRQMYLGQGGHILTFPIRKGDALNIVAFRTDKNGEVWEDRQWVLPSSREAVLKDFEGWSEKPMKILELIDEPDKWALFEHPACTTFTHPTLPFCILGDAAHATTPHLGAGAGFAIEDAYILSGLLHSLDQPVTAADLHRVMEVYDEVRRPRSQELVVKSRKQGMLFDLTPEDGEKVEDWKLKVVTQTELSAHWVWRVDLLDTLERAKKMLNA
ncbi:hypothetical protein BX600DRAFT_507374 [Xylariales sp. PMI_506]|nr:hypothetical protein BX600DRAFT_507374 [Xylariales sp. PMI_506]